MLRYTLSLLILWATVFNALGKRDVEFFVDADGSLMASDLDLIKTFVKNVIAGISDNSTSFEFDVAVTSFAADVTHLRLFGNTAKTADAAVDEIDNQGKKMETATGFSLAATVTKNFMPARMDPDIGYIVLVTDGGATPDEADKAAMEAESFKMSPNKQFIYVVAIGTNVTEDKLMEVASDPETEYYIPVAGFSSLAAEADGLATKLKAATPPTPAPPLATGGSTRTTAAPWWVCLLGLLALLSIRDLSK